MKEKIEWSKMPEMVGWNKVKSLRKMEGLTQPELAVGAGVSITTIWYIENGLEEKAKDETKKKIADYFNVEVSELFPAEMIGNITKVEFHRLRDDQLRTFKAQIQMFQKKEKTTHDKE